jgi:hypothetical protein
MPNNITLELKITEEIERDYVDWCIPSNGDLNTSSFI